jgi:phosphatidylglycerophosphatase A
MTSLAVLVATAGGVGRVRIAPGTAGSAVGLAIYLGTRHLPELWQVGSCVAICAIGVWASGVAARHFASKDPGAVVIDEVAGQLLTYLLIPLSAAGAIVGFVIFRIFDIIKPWPANRLESLPGGWGVMADDLMAAVYGHIVLRLAVFVFPGYL